MEIFIVIYEISNPYRETLHESFETEVSAKSFAVNTANSIDKKLDTILRIDTVRKKVTEYDLAIERGKFTLIKRKEDN